MHVIRAGALLVAVLVAVADLPRALAEAVPTVIVALALDTSGSVGKEDLERARALSLAILQGLPAGSEVAVLTFDDHSRIVVPRTTRPQEVKARLKSLGIAGRYTALHDALYDASRYLRDAPAERKAIVLITDGKDENSALNLEDGLKLAQDERIPVFTVGVGQPQERVLRRIAKLTGGEYLGLRQAKGTALAAKIAGLRRGEAAPAATVAQALPAPVAEPARAPGTEPARAPAASSSRKGLALGGVLLLVAAGLAVVLLKKGRGLDPVPASGRGRTVNGEDVSPTVLARMNITEEFLEKTVTLKERPVLSVTRGPGAGQVHDLRRDSATSIGRAKANDIVVGDVAVSSQHCRIRPEDGRFVLHDLKSTNGTFVNERKVGRHVLTEGDVIKLGETSLQFKLDLKRD